MKGDAFGPGSATMWDPMRSFLENIETSHLPALPSAILVVSAHWEETEWTVTSGSKPSLIYDYYGFPPHTYELKYEAPGSVEVATRVKELINLTGATCNLDASRGWDHGIFIPMLIAFPRADIPIVQLSLKANLDPAEHIAVGAALSNLRDENILIIGSGMSYHNMRGFGGGGGDAKRVSVEFDRFLTEASTKESSEERNQLLAQWVQGPEARNAHPREEHLLPLHVCAGTAKEVEKGEKIFEGEVLGVTVSGFKFA